MPLALRSRRVADQLTRPESQPRASPADRLSHRSRLLSTDNCKTQIEKYKLVMSHTARRTGATLMYLAGMDKYDYFD